MFLVLVFSSSSRSSPNILSKEPDIGVIGVASVGVLWGLCSLGELGIG